MLQLSDTALWPIFLGFFLTNAFRKPKQEGLPVGEGPRGS